MSAMDVEAQQNTTSRSIKLNSKVMDHIIALRVVYGAVAFLAFLVVIAFVYIGIDSIITGKGIQVTIGIVMLVVSALLAVVIVLVYLHKNTRIIFCLEAKARALL